jgi:uncharacterized OB-fold protein
MPESIAAQPELYSAIHREEPSLNGARCRACGYVFFPPQPYGCDSCGASPEQVEAFALAGRGTLHASATVHHHQGKDIQAPFTVGLIVLDDGPAIRAILAAPTDEGLRIGDRMHSLLVPVGRDASAREIVELRFTKMEDGR